MLLTRLPAGWLLRGEAPAPLADATWAFPVVGALVGYLGATVYWGGFHLGLPPAVAAVWTLAALLLMTGALHEDGLADAADGFAGGRTREKRLEIMRDSRIGSFGALALMLTLAARGTAIAALATPLHVASALITAGAMGRGAMLVVLLAAEPARPDGLAAGLREPGVWRVVVGLLLAACPALSFPGAAWAIPLAALVAGTVVWTTRRQIGGYTGDVLGATSVLTECIVLGMSAAEAGRFNP